MRRATMLTNSGQPGQQSFENLEVDVINIKKKVQIL